MKKIKIFSGNWTETDVSGSDSIFVYGDNLKRTGKGGQAVIRELPNSIGLVTKKEPSNNLDAFFNDSEIELNSKFILKDILEIKLKQILGEQLIFSSGGYGTGLSKMPEKAPNTFLYLNELLQNFFHYDNLSGKVKTKLPSSDDIILGNYLGISEISKPESNLSFNEFSLNNGIYNIYDLIKSEHKISVITDKKFDLGDIILFSEPGKDYLICRVIHESIGTDEIEDIHRFEGYKVEDNLDSKFLTFFEFISTLDPKSNRMVYNERFFNFGNSKQKDVQLGKSEITIEEKVNNLEKKVDALFDFLKSKLG